MTTMKAVRLNASTFPVEPQERRILAEAGVDLVCIEGRDPAEILDAAHDCDALLVISASLPAKVVQGLTRCRTIARMGAGTDKIDVALATERGIVVSNVPDFCLGEQADHTMALLLSSARRLPFMQQGMREGNWAARSHPGVRRIEGRCLGLLGFGASAQAVARRAAGFGLQLMAWTRSPDKYGALAAALGVRMVPLDELLAQCHFVSLHLPLSSETRHLLGTRELALLRPDAVIINTARGAIIDEAALVDCLRRGAIAGAALDTFETIDVFAPPGPAPKHALLEFDNVIATPHCAGSSVESTLDSKVRGVRHAVQVLQGHWPTHVVNAQVVPHTPLKR